mmetsp:Transcript_31532/g.82414  ORF Transcript_31532/g.82414 Transcript_31532/m.82414 type:complete len:124 (-) Transcript_31532:584-955(-)
MMYLDALESPAACCFSLTVRLRMTSVAVMRCRTSRNEDGSSNMYTSASRSVVHAIAKRCSSPPESAWTSRSRRCMRSSFVAISSQHLRSSQPLSTAPTLWPTSRFTKSVSSCTLTATLRSSSR